MKPEGLPSSNENGMSRRNFMAAVLAAGAAASGLTESRAGAENATQETEAEKVRKRALAFLDRLYNLPDQSSDRGPAYAELQKRRVARTLIDTYALKRKVEPTVTENPATGTTTRRVSGIVERQDRVEALEELKNHLHEYAADNFGNKSGEFDDEKRQELEASFSNNIGFQTLKVAYENEK